MKSEERKKKNGFKIKKENTNSEKNEIEYI